MRFLRFKRWLAELRNARTTSTRLFRGSPSFMLAWMPRMPYGFMGHLTAWCEHHGIPYLGRARGDDQEARDRQKATPARTR